MFRAIAAIGVVALIVIGVVVYKALENRKAVRQEKFRELQRDRNFYRSQVAYLHQEMDTIARTSDDSKFNATVALEEYARKQREYDEQNELEQA